MIHVSGVRIVRARAAHRILTKWYKKKNAQKMTKAHILMRQNENRKERGKKTASLERHHHIHSSSTNTSCTSIVEKNRAQKCGIHNTHAPQYTSHTSPVSTFPQWNPSKNRKYTNTTIILTERHLHTKHPSISLLLALMSFLFTYWQI